MIVLCWDFDGTLTYSDPLWTNSVYHALKMTDPYTPVSFQDIRPFMASGFPWHTPDSDYRKTINDHWWHHMNHYFFQVYQSLGVSDSVAALSCKKIRSIIRQAKNYRLYEDALSTLQQTSGKCQNIILSNNHPDLREVIHALGLSPFFQDYIISAEIGYDKPRPEIFQLARSRYPHGTRFIMIGDSIHADIIGGKNARMETILVHKGYCEQADYCCEQLEEIPKILSKKLRILHEKSVLPQHWV